MTFISDPSSLPNPVFDYSSRDYQSVYTDLVNRIPVYLPEWTSRSQSDFGIVLLQMYAYTVDLIGYYLDRLAGEAFIQTATQPSSIVNLAAMLDYQPTLSVGSTVALQVEISSDINGPIVIPAGSVFSTLASDTQAAIPFFTTAALTIAGSTAATPSTIGVVEAQQGTVYTNEVVGSADGTINQSYLLQHNTVSAEWLHGVCRPGSRAARVELRDHADQLRSVRSGVHKLR